MLAVHFRNPHGNASSGAPVTVTGNLVQCLGVNRDLHSCKRVVYDDAFPVHVVLKKPVETEEAECLIRVHLLENVVIFIVDTTKIGKVILDCRRVEDVALKKDPVGENPVHAVLKKLVSGIIEKKLALVLELLPRLVHELGLDLEVAQRHVVDGDLHPVLIGDATALCHIHDRTS